MSSRYIVIRYYESNDEITDQKSEGKYAKVTAVRNPLWESWKESKLPRWIVAMDEWDNGGHLNGNGQVKSCPAFPEPPKMYLAKMTYISRAEADKLIEDADLYPTLCCSYGKVYDTLARDFQTEYKGLIKLP